MKRIYLDHAAATPLDPRVKEAMDPYWSSEFGNPSAIHKEGVTARLAINHARGTIAKEIGAHSDEIIFTGSATESCNLAIVGAVRAWKKDHPDRIPEILVSAIEHDAVLAPARLLASEGVRVTYIPVDMEGVIEMGALKSFMTLDTVLVSIMHANNEIGAIQPIVDVAKVIGKWKKEERGVTRDEAVVGDNRYPLLHSDASQSANYLELNVRRLGVDMLTLSSAKIYGPKGIGLLFRARGTPLLPLIHGGGQESGLRAGTENLPLIVGFREALSIAVASRVHESERLTQLRDMLIGGLQGIEGVCMNGSLTTRLPNNVNFSLNGADHEFLVLALDAKGIAVSTKSACNETDADTSHVLSALVVAGHKGGKSGIRVTLGRSTTKEDIETFLSVLRHIIDNLIVTIK